MNAAPQGIIADPLIMTAEIGSAELSLGEIADRSKFTVAERIAISDATVRRTISYATAAVFLATNILTVAGVAILVWLDRIDLANGAIRPAERIVTTEVVIMIVGATTVQLGALALTMGRYLYSPGRGRAEELSDN